MSDQYWLTKAQLKNIGSFFPRTRGIPRVDDRRVVSGIIHVIRNGLRWRDTPAVYGPHKTLDNPFVRSSRITPCILPRAKRRLPATYCKTLYRQGHKVENMFAKLKEIRLGHWVRLTANWSLHHPRENAIFPY